VQAATGLEAQPSPNSTSQVTRNVTQIQIGCISECFGTTTKDPSTAALTQQFLAALSSVQPTCGSSSPQPTPATDVSVVDEVACQVQDAQATATQTQVASQSATTVQVSNPAPVSEPRAPRSIAQAQQGTWQLQIGCVFYCVDTQQVQQAQQSITIVQVQTVPSGSNPGAVDVTDQTVWQVQIGCIAWCYDATQVQVVTGQRTVIVDRSAPPASAPPPPLQPNPPPPSGPPPPTAPAPGSPGPAQQPAPVPVKPTGTTSPSPVATSTSPVPTSLSPPIDVAPEPTNSFARHVRLLRAVAEAGSIVSTVSAVSTATAPVARVREATPAVALAPVWGTPTVTVRVSIAADAHANVRPSRHSVAQPKIADPVRVARVLAAEPTASHDSPAVVLALAAAAAALVFAAIRRRPAGNSKR
jgi:hypothetical protein